MNLWYRNVAGDLDIASRIFYETQPTHGITVVSATSADPGVFGVLPIPIDADHFQVCCPPSRDDVRYLQTLRFLNERIPQVDEPRAAEDKVSNLRKSLLTAQSQHDLRRVRHELDALIAEAPHNTDALMLRDEIDSALSYESRPAARVGASRDIDYCMRALAYGSGLGCIAGLLTLAVFAYGIYRLVSWFPGW